MTARRSRRTRLGPAGVIAALACASLAACGTAKPAAQPPLAPVPVKLAAAPGAGGTATPVAAVPTLTIGVVYTNQSQPGQGSDWLATSAGAIVAQYRSRLGGTTVNLTPVDDHGTRAGARAAFRRLAADNVSGIVVASTGDHLDPGLAIASSAGIPTLLPYDDSAQAAGDVWLTGPSQHDVDTALTRALRAAHATRPFVITADGVETPGVGAARTARLTPTSTGTLAKDVTSALAKRAVDSVVVAGSAASEAKVIAALQSANVEAPVIAGPAAVSPSFAADLTADGGTTGGEFTTVGTDTGDAAALAAGDAGARASAFFAAVRLAAGDASLHDLLGGPFSSDAAYADIASHDAVVALVDAARKAGSADPAKVAAALRGLKLGGNDGLAGPSLDFTGNDALAAGATVVLHATADDPGVRAAPAVSDRSNGTTTTADAPTLYWFASPRTSND